MSGLFGFIKCRLRCFTPTLVRAPYDFYYFCYVSIRVAALTDIRRSIAIISSLANTLTASDKSILRFLCSKVQFYEQIDAIEFVQQKKEELSKTTLQQNNVDVGKSVQDGKDDSETRIQIF
jgi:hypothetical protein